MEMDVANRMMGRPECAVIIPANRSGILSAFIGRILG